MWNFFDLVKQMGLQILDIGLAPESPGYYMLFADGGSFIYVGKADNLKTRLSRHFSSEEENERIRGIVKSVIWQKTSTVSDAEAAEGELYDFWVKKTGVPPIANKIKPPKSRLGDNEILVGMLRELFQKYESLRQK